MHLRIGFSYDQSTRIFTDAQIILDPLLKYPSSTFRFTSILRKKMDRSKKRENLKSLKKKTLFVAPNLFSRVDDGTHFYTCIISIYLRSCEFCDIIVQCILNNSREKFE